MHSVRPSQATAVFIHIQWQIIHITLEVDKVDIFHFIQCRRLVVMTGNGKVLAVVANCHLKLMVWMTPAQKVTCFISPPDSAWKLELLLCSQMRCRGWFCIINFLNHQQKQNTGNSLGKTANRVQTASCQLKLTDWLAPCSWAGKVNVNVLKVIVSEHTLWKILCFSAPFICLKPTSWKQLLSSLTCFLSSGN